MRALFFVKPLEIVLETEKDFFTQGEPIIGSLKITNQGSENYTIEKEALNLSYGDIKKVYAGKDGALKQISVILPIENYTIAAGQSETLSFNHLIQTDGPVTSKLAAPFFSILGQTYSMQIKEHLYLSEVIKVMESFFRFRLKKTSYKIKNKVVEYQMISSSTGEMKNIESVTLALAFVENTLSCKFSFKVKVFENNYGMNLKESKEVKTEKLLITETEFTFGPNMVDSERLRLKFEQVIKKMTGNIFGV